MTVKIDLKVELTDIEKVVPSPKNAKKHSDDQVKVLAGLIKERGWTQPIIVDADGEIIAGHGRRLAALKLGLKKVPVIWRRDLTKQEAEMLRLADNRVVSNDYDTQLLQDAMRELDGLGVSLMDLGFSMKEQEFLVSDDMAQINEDVFVDDVSEAVEQQKSNNEAKSEEVDKSQAPVGDALGFKRVTIEQSRKIREFIGNIESLTGKKGVDAFMEHIEGQS